jgi:hypothetical protein
VDVLTGARTFAKFVSNALDSADDFRLVDVGCSNGIHDAFRAFGDRLSVWAFDIDDAECRRLQAIEPCAGVRYIAGAVRLTDDHPFIQARLGRPQLPGNPWERLSVAETLRLRAVPARPTESKPNPMLASPSQVNLSQFLKDNAIHDVDFVKIDVDGEDFAILSGLNHTLFDLNVLGVGIEVNFFGTEHPTDHSWHNVDRFMRGKGYDLFALTTRHYSASALPSRYISSFPTETSFGRLLQGDALYMRDLCAPTMRQIAQRLAPAKLLKATAVLSLCNLPDCAAEILTTFRGELSSAIDVDRALDLLVKTARDDRMPTTYSQYMAAFRSDAPCFYAPPPAADPSTQGADAGALLAQRDELLRENARLSEELQAVYQSRCWRATAPLRRLVDLTRKSSPLSQNHV